MNVTKHLVSKKSQSESLAKPCSFGTDKDRHSFIICDISYCDKSVVSFHKNTRSSVCLERLDYTET